MWFYYDLPLRNIISIHNHTLTKSRIYFHSLISKLVSEFPLVVYYQFSSHFFFLIEPKKSWFTLISMSLKCKVVFIVRGTWRCSCAHISSTKVRKGQWEKLLPWGSAPSLPHQPRWARRLWGAGHTWPWGLGVMTAASCLAVLLRTWGQTHARTFLVSFQERPIVSLWTCSFQAALVWRK